VTEAVVVALEPVEVDHDDAQRAALAGRPADLALERLLHVPPVIEAGQRVAGGLEVERLAQPEVRKREREQLGDPHRELADIRIELAVDDPPRGRDVEHAERGTLGRHRDADVGTLGVGRGVAAAWAELGGLDDVQPALAQRPAVLGSEHLGLRGGLAPACRGLHHDPRLGQRENRPGRPREQRS
jgi:hypothetical protein